MHSGHVRTLEKMHSPCIRDTYVLRKMGQKVHSRYVNGPKIDDMLYLEGYVFYIKILRIWYVLKKTIQMKSEG